MTEFFNKLKKKTLFGPFLTRFPCVKHNFVWVPNTMPNLEKINNPISRKRPDTQTDGQTLFYWTLTANDGGSN